MKKMILSVTLFVFCFLIPFPSAASGQAGSEDIKTGILLVAFGTSVPEARTAFDNMDRKVRQAFPDIPVFWAYTSRIIRKKLADAGQALDSEASALLKMADQGFTHVAIQSLHTIPGEEFHKLVRTARTFEGLPGGIRKISIGLPLLSGQDDMEAVTAAILANIPASRKKTDAVILMGHGSPHPANTAYAALLFHLRQKDPLVLLGTLDTPDKNIKGSPGLDDIITVLEAKKPGKVFLMPFMSVAGDHARNDLAGDEDDSWKSILEKRGFTCEIILKGTAEYDNMADIWISHLRDAMLQLARSGL